MESDLEQHHPRHLHQIQQQQQQMNSGLTRYRSAPSSFFNDTMNRELCLQFFNHPSSPETEQIFAHFMNSGDDPLQLSDPPKPSLLNQNQNQNQNQSNNETMGVNYSSSPASPAASFYQSNPKPPLPSHGMKSGNETSPFSMGMNTPMFPPMRTGGANNTSSGLTRHNSSPAGMFAKINIDTSGFGAMRGMGTYGASNNSTSKEASFSPPSRLQRTSSTGPMSPIAEIDDKSLVGTNKHDNSYVPSFPMGSWDDSAIVSDNITSLKRLRDIDQFDDVKQFAVSESQNLESGNRPPMLTHHLSLPKTSAEMAAIEKFLQFQDSVPCKIRAKRGCATHPRSIAERVRRTRISERMRKLQELVPNMEKQTNTSDMLDLAVEYIKDLQKQVQTLSDTRAKCVCSKQQQQQ